MRYEGLDAAELPARITSAARCGAPGHSRSVPRAGGMWNGSGTADCDSPSMDIRPLVLIGIPLFATGALLASGSTASAAPQPGATPVSFTTAPLAATGPASPAPGPTPIAFTTSPLAASGTVTQAPAPITFTTAALVATGTMMPTPVIELRAPILRKP
jgi:hypothetical protein